jgi:hypothetical protein
MSCCRPCSINSNQQSVSRLLQLPDACLLEVLCRCTTDPRSLFSAARAHSRLHQTAVLAASSISAVVSEAQVDSVLEYLRRYGQHIDSIDLECKGWPRVTLQQLPHSSLPQLSSLRLGSMALQLQPGPGTYYGNGAQGVLRAGAPLKQLRLHHCLLLVQQWPNRPYNDRETGLAAALALLPDLQHLSLVWNRNVRTASYISACGDALAAVQRLTHLELTGGPSPDPGSEQQPQSLTWLQGLPHLQDLLLDSLGAHTIQAGSLSVLQRLTRLKLHGVGGSSVLEPGEGLRQVPTSAYLPLSSCRVRRLDAQLS